MTIAETASITKVLPPERLAAPGFRQRRGRGARMIGAGTPSGRDLGIAIAALEDGLAIPSDQGDRLRKAVSLALRRVRATLVRLANRPVPVGRTVLGAADVDHLLAFVDELVSGTTTGMPVRELRSAGNELLLDLVRYRQQVADLLGGTQ